MFELKLSLDIKLLDSLASTTISNTPYLYQYFQMDFVSIFKYIVQYIYLQYFTLSTNIYSAGNRKSNSHN